MPRRFQLGPESFRFSDSVEARAVKSTERYYILRPETVEAYFYLWRLTKDQKYRDWAWDAAQVSEQQSMERENHPVPVRSAQLGRMTITKTSLISAAKCRNEC